MVVTILSLCLKAWQVQCACGWMSQDQTTPNSLLMKSDPHLTIFGEDTYRAQSLCCKYCNIAGKYKKLPQLASHHFQKAYSLNLKYWLVSHLSRIYGKTLTTIYR